MKGESHNKFIKAYPTDDPLEHVTTSYCDVEIYNAVSASSEYHFSEYYVTGKDK